MTARISLVTLTALFVVIWLVQDYTNNIYQLWAMEIIRTFLFWSIVPLASLSLTEWCECNDL